MYRTDKQQNSRSCAVKTLSMITEQQYNDRSNNNSKWGGLPDIVFLPCSYERCSTSQRAAAVGFALDIYINYFFVEVALAR